MRHKKGFSIISAIFILVVLSVAAAFSVTLSGAARYTSLLSLQGERAYHSARSGIEWAIFQIVANPIVCPPTTALNLNEAGLSGFTATVSCSLTSYTEGLNTMNIFTVTSIGEYNNIGNTDYVSRRLEVTINRRI